MRSAAPAPLCSPLGSRRVPLSPAVDACPIPWANGIMGPTAPRDTPPRAVRDKQLMRADRNRKRKKKREAAAERRTAQLHKQQVGVRPQVIKEVAAD